MLSNQKTNCVLWCLLHNPGYRTKYADNLKRELPRIPFAPELRPSAKAGEKLAKLHLDYEQLKPWELDFIETPGNPLSYRIKDKMRLSKDKLSLTVNPSLTLAGMPPEVFECRLVNRSALEWVIDQYQVSTDKRSGITSDPNRDDDPEYIVRLVGQVIRVSLETVKLVDGLPVECEQIAGAPGPQGADDPCSPVTDALACRIIQPSLRDWVRGARSWR